MTTRVLRVGVALWALAAIVALAFGRAAWLGVLTGGGIGLANFWGLTRLVGGIVRGSGSRALLGVVLALKFLLLALAVFASLRYLAVSPMAFLIGISIFVVAIFVAAARGLSALVASETGAQTEAEAKR